MNDIQIQMSFVLLIHKTIMINVICGLQVHDYVMTSNRTSTHLAFLIFLHLASGHQFKNTPSPPQTL